MAKRPWLCPLFWLCPRLCPLRALNCALICATLEEGQFITAGQTITYILPDTQKWIIANYKETQIENLRPGQEVTITVDAVSDRKFTGKITAISGATGSKYSLVPTDNSAGNFVKIQQRIPVRIDFTDLSKEDNEKLAAGMMVIVKVKL